MRNHSRLARKIIESLNDPNQEWVQLSDEEEPCPQLEMYCLFGKPEVRVCIRNKRTVTLLIAHTVPHQEITDAFDGRLQFSIRAAIARRFAVVKDDPVLAAEEFMFG